MVQRTEEHVGLHYNLDIYPYLHAGSLFEAAEVIAESCHYLRICRSLQPYLQVELLPNGKMDG